MKKSKLTTEDVTDEIRQAIFDEGEFWYNVQSEPLDVPAARKAVIDVYTTVLEKTAPAILVAKGPMQALTWASQLRTKDDKAAAAADVQRYISIWWVRWVSRYRIAAKMGCPLPMDKLELLTNFVRHVPFIVPYEKVAIICLKPAVKFEVVGRTTSSILTSETQVQIKLLHCDDGPAVEYQDGFKLWYIHGIRVNEQIVMSPEEQTIKQMEEEPNADVQALRFERYGYGKYLAEAGCTLIDERMHPRDNLPEKLYRDKAERHRLVVTDPSTNRLVTMLVPSECVTCKQAQAFITHGADDTAMCRT